MPGRRRTQAGDVLMRVHGHQGQVLGEPVAADDGQAVVGDVGTHRPDIQRGHAMETDGLPGDSDFHRDRLAAGRGNWPGAMPPQLAAQPPAISHPAGS